VPFLVVSAIAGTAQGASNSGSMRAVFAHVLPEDRAGTLATLYLISYAVLPFEDWRRGDCPTRWPCRMLGRANAVLVVVAATLALVTRRVRARKVPPESGERRV
jgi:hypothetical protein